MNFLTLLNYYIEKNNSSNNQVINISGIDRSTFYKILKGTRYPTEKQFYSILKGLDLATSERIELIELYEREVYDDEILLEKNFVKSMMDVISDYNSNISDGVLSINYDDHNDNQKLVAKGVNNVREMLKEDISKELLCNKNQLSFFVSLNLLKKLGMFEYLQFISSDANSRVAQIRHLVEIPVDNIFIIDDIVNIVKSYLTFLLGQNLNYEAKYYKANGNALSQMGVIYPYYVITSDSVLLINRDGTSMLRLDDKDQLKCYKENFDALMAESEYLVSRFSEKERYVSLIGDRNGKKLYILEKKPGLSFLATEQFMNKYISDSFYKEMLKKHVGCFLNNPHMEIISNDGLWEFIKSDYIEEAGFRIDIKNGDIEVALEQMKSRLHKTLEILDSNKLPLSDNWSITVVENEYIILVPYFSNDKIIYIPEKNIVNAFTRFLEKLGDYGYFINDLEIPVE